jgi:pectate lyase
MGVLVAALLTIVAACVVSPPLAHATPDDPAHVVDAWYPDADASRRALAGSYTGFGAAATGGEGRPVLVVTSLADSGIGSIRSALDTAVRIGGGRIVFTVGGDVVLRDALRVPANVTLDGLTAPVPGITLWGERLTAGGGVLVIERGNVVVRGLRIRNAVNDGIHIAAKDGIDVARVVIDHCSVTNSADGGIDVTGSTGARVRDVTLSWNYLAANGGPCASKEWCGGAALVKYGVERISVHGNVWDKNLRRNPSIDGTETLADVRGNVVRGYVESGTQLRGGATGNVVANFFEGARPLLAAGASVFAAGNAGAAVAGVARPFDVADPLAIVERAQVMASAGAPPHDAIDAAYRDEIATYESAKNVVVTAADVAPTPTEAVATPPFDATALAASRADLRAARRLWSRGRRAEARLAYTALIARLAAARGINARPATGLASDAALALATLERNDAPAAIAHAEAAREHAHRAGDVTRVRRADRLLRRLAR